MEHYICYCKLSLLAVLSLITACCMLSRRWYVNLQFGRIETIESMLGINESGNAACLLSFSNGMDSQCSLTG